MEKDHYERLGVIDTAELAVIKAAYKALMQIYHPDRFDSEIEKANATQIAKEINEAYRVLSDPLLRKKYDEQRAKNKNEYKPDTGDATENKQKNGILEDSWKIAAQYVENLESIYHTLADISPELGFTFKLELIESKKFNKAKSIASRLEKEYLERYFGANRSVQHFAKWLLLNDKRQIALEVNKATVVLGKRFNTNKFIDSFITKYQLTYQQQNKRWIRRIVIFLMSLVIFTFAKSFFLEFMKTKINEIEKQEITIQSGVNSVNLQGVYHLKKFQNHGFFGNMITGKYNHLQLNYAIRFKDEYDESGTVMNVNAVALQLEKPDLISKIKDGDEINVHCNLLYNGEQASPHYAPLVHCVADSISEVETRK